VNLPAQRQNATLNACRPHDAWDTLSAERLITFFSFVKFR
jgi:hypothetical protein